MTGIYLGLILSLIMLMPLSIKWELEKKITLPAALIIGILSGITAGKLPFSNIYQNILFQFFSIIFTAALLLLWRFYRDPERVPPKNENAIISPADGKIIYIKKIEDGIVPASNKGGKIFSLGDFTKSEQLPKGGYLIGISMNFLDVHVNRAPIGGRICALSRIEGLFVSLKKSEALIQNERVLTIIDNGHFKVGVVQIASRLVRNIVPYVKEGIMIQKGGKIGAIRFGSQVDIFLPALPSLFIEINPGDKVFAGESIIAAIEK